jgi:hypothetical protein
MASLNEISGIGGSDVELLDMAGIRDAKHLAEQNPEELWARVKQTNDLLHIREETPDIATLVGWMERARQPSSQILYDPRKAALATAVNYEGNEQVAEMLARSPFAIPLPGRFLMKKKIKVSDIPPGILLNRYSGDLDVRIGNPEIQPTEVPQRRPAVAAEIGHKPQQAQFDPSSLKSIAQERDAPSKTPRSSRSPEEDRVSLIRAPLESTNRGKNPNSRRFIRGVLHTHPWHLRIGAFFALLIIPLLPISVISAMLLLLSKMVPDSFLWVPKWLLAFPIALPVVGIGYLIWGLTGKCRICTQKLFVHTRALKHGKAHRLFYLGYVLPLSLHLLLFSWFRCSSCGTPIRLKK